MTVTGFRWSCVTLAMFDSTSVKNEPGSSAGLIDAHCTPAASCHPHRRIHQAGEADRLHGRCPNRGSYSPCETNPKTVLLIGVNLILQSAPLAAIFCRHYSERVRVRSARMTGTLTLLSVLRSWWLCGSLSVFLNYPTYFRAEKVLLDCTDYKFQ